MNRVFASLHDLIEVLSEDYAVFNGQVLFEDGSCQDCCRAFTHDDLVSFCHHLEG